MMYTNDLDVIARCRKSGLSIEPVDTVPDDYTHAVEQMKAEALREVRPAVAPQDGSDRYNYAAGHCASP
ncbi:hypothetical protein B1L11_38515 [Microbispora sp. GKU 823]|nr:hypothetical protein B1L11_38515 [Microbispora sp. GKU 823]